MSQSQSQSQSQSRKRKVIQSESGIVSAAAATDAVTKRPREHLIPINYLDVLPKDVLSHLFFYIKLLDDEDMYALAKTSRTMLTFIQTRYRLMDQTSWYFYRVGDIKWHEVKLPWGTNEEEGDPYLFVCSVVQLVDDDVSTDESLASLEEESSVCVILRHTLDKAILTGLKTLPFESFVLNEYQPNRFAIGQITRLVLQMVPAHPQLIGEVDPIRFNLPHLKLLPPSLTDLELCEVFVNPSEMNQPCVWPPKLESLKLDGFSGKTIGHEMLSLWPSSLTSLTLERGSTRPRPMQPWINFHDTCLPQTLLHLHMGDGFNDWVESSFFERSDLIAPASERRPSIDTSSLKTVHVGCWFKPPPSRWILPAGLEKLAFTEFFHLSIKDVVFNETLTHLNLGHLAGQSILGVTFPSSLVHLEFGRAFQQSLLRVGLPNGLQTLIYGVHIDPSIFHPEFSLPRSLAKLHMGSEFPAGQDPLAAMRSYGNHRKFVDPTATSVHQIHLVPNLTYLQMPLCLIPYISRLPTTIEELVIDSERQELVPPDEIIRVLNTMFGVLPNLRRLSIDLLTLDSIDGIIFPSSLEWLKFIHRRKLHSVGNFWFGSVTMGPKLKYLHFGSPSLNQSKLPESLEVIRFGYVFNQPLRHVVFPQSLRAIYFGASFNHSLDKVNFPPNLEVLSLNLSRGFNHSLVHCKLPASLKTIQLSPEYDCTLSGFIVPPGLQTFEIGSKDEGSEFSHLESLSSLRFPSTMRFIRLPNPRQYTYHEEHPALGSYKEWLTQLSHLHPYARVEFTRSNRLFGTRMHMHIWIDHGDGETERLGSKSSTLSDVSDCESEFDEEDEDQEDADDEIWEDQMMDEVNHDTQSMDEGESVSPPALNPPSATPPATRLVGIELNPGPQSTLPIASTMVSHISNLPLDLLLHLCRSRFLCDRDVFAFAATSHQLFNMIAPRYEHTSSKQNWYLYRVSEVEPHIQLPWSNSSDSARYEQPHKYVLQCPVVSGYYNFDDEESLGEVTSVAWIILRHTLEAALKLGWKSLPYESLMLNKYQATNSTIGHISTLTLTVPEKNDEYVKSSEYARIRVHPRIHLPHLHFLPHQSLTDLTFLDDVFITDLDVVKACVWPKKLRSLHLIGFNPHMFNRTMLAHWPVSLKRLILASGELGWRARNPDVLHFPESILSISLISSAFHGLDLNRLRLPGNLVECRIAPHLNGIRPWMTAPKSLTNLNLDCSCHLNVDDWILPTSVLELRFGMFFVHPIQKMHFNQQLTTLILGAFDQPLTGVIFPPSLTHLEFGQTFKQTLLGVDLQSTQLTTLIYGVQFDPAFYEPSFILPQTLRKLQLGHQHLPNIGSDQTTNEYVRVLPPLVELHISPDALFHVHVPAATLETMFIKDTTEYVQPDPKRAQQVSLLLKPCPHLTTVNLSCNVPWDGLRLPDSVEVIDFGSKSEQFIRDLTFGPNVRRVSFGPNFHPDLTTIKFTSSSSLRELFCFGYLAPTESCVLPATLETLRLTCGLNQPHQKLTLPSTLKSFTLHCPYDSNQFSFALPDQLELLNVSCSSIGLASLTFAQLQLPSSLRTVCAPNPLRLSAKEKDQTTVSAYKAWIAKLVLTHPYLQLVF